MNEIGGAHLLQLPRCDLNPKKLLQPTVVVSRDKIKEVLEKNESVTLKYRRQERQARKSEKQNKHKFMKEAERRRMSPLGRFC